MSTHRITLLVNGDRHHLDVEARHTLADVLRDRLGLTATHVGCEQGVCGSCTVLLDGEPGRSCLSLAVACDEMSIRTVEGLADDDGPLHPVQQALLDADGLQCGFCTPGFLMLLAGVLEEDPDVGDEELDHALSSNLCRCTGYAPLHAAARAARAVHRDAAREVAVDLACDLVHPPPSPVAAEP